MRGGPAHSVVLFVFGCIGITVASWDGVEFVYSLHESYYRTIVLFTSLTLSIRFDWLAVVPHARNGFRPGPQLALTALCLT